MKKNILFLCTGNSCRSQMAHGLCENLHSDKFNVYSAGVKKHGLNPLAVKVMGEIDLDISHHKSELTEELDTQNFDYVITVCSAAKETCPYFPGGKIIHYGFDDPPSMTKGLPEETALPIYRRVRDEIKEFVENIEKHL